MKPAHIATHGTSFFPHTYKIHRNHQTCAVKTAFYTGTFIQLLKFRWIREFYWSNTRFGCGLLSVMEQLDMTKQVENTFPTAQNLTLFSNKRKRKTESRQNLWNLCVRPVLRQNTVLADGAELLQRTFRILRPSSSISISFSPIFYKYVNEICKSHCCEN
jgi:hypothetical protein